jgi:hypothetical protein
MARREKNKLKLRGGGRAIEGSQLWWWRAVLGEVHRFVADS